MVEENNIAGAIQKLEHDIKDKLMKWLVDDYEKENLLQYSKDEIMGLVEKTIERLAIINGQ